MTDKLLLNIEDAADRLSIGRTTMYELVASGQVQSLRIGRSRRIHVDELERFARQRADYPITYDAT